MLSEILVEITNNNFGVEIGVPTPCNEIIYENSSSMDNIIFSKDTIWGSNKEEYNYYNNKKGKNIINDSVNIYLINDETYDFCFASHSL